MPTAICTTQLGIEGSGRCIKVAAIHLDTIRPIIDQLWAEAVAVYHAGAPWWLAADLEHIAAGVQHERLTRDPWQDVLSASPRDVSPAMSSPRESASSTWVWRSATEP